MAAPALIVAGLVSVSCNERRSTYVSCRLAIPC